MSPSQTTDDVTILEIREASPTHFLMKVESFSMLGKNGIHKYESGEFRAGEHKWRLILYPNEDKNVNTYLWAWQYRTQLPRNQRTGRSMLSSPSLS
ncbi:hypothetical protein ACS0TY_025785 [Phlomoides rotata]